jgi:dynein heavy chain
MAGYDLIQIEISKNYGKNEWRDDIKKVPFVSMAENAGTGFDLFLLFEKIFMKAGAEGKPTVFLFSDNQIKEESFVEDINMILNTADIPNLFAAEEKAEIIEKMQQAVRLEVIALASSRRQQESISLFFQRTAKSKPRPWQCTIFS